MSDRLRLVLLSFLMLFTELALIRWTGSNVLYLSFFSNFVLLGSFLGIGVGFLWAGRSERRLYPYAPIALLALVAFIRFLPVEVERGGRDLVFFGGLDTSGPPRWIVLPVIFVVVAAALAFIGEGVARVFGRFEPLRAYKLDLVGSVLGIVGFSVVSFLRAPPIVWGVVFAVVFALTVELPLGRRHLARAGQVAALAAIVAILAVESFGAGQSWSPYYKITAERDEGSGTTIVSVNGVPHQFHQTADAAPGRVVYDVARPPNLGRVLVIGAGGGNDVAVALARGAEHVDAVEIDPRIHDLGKSRHPERPYQDPRVDAHIDDGRAFLERTKERYDLILFALPDSITLVSGQSSLRLESFLFTKEALSTARDRLAPGGVFAMYNYFREDWLADRYANTLTEVYGAPPCAQFFDLFGDPESNFAVFVAARDAASIDCTGPHAATWEPATDDFPGPATDDHPFPYLRDRTVPGFYAVTILLILLVSAGAIRVAGGPLRPMSGFLDLFFMGAAFLLLETKNVVQFALLFGTTWFVNALVFLGVLLSVLGAVLVAQRVTFARPARLYIVLLAAIAVAAAVPQSALLELGFVARFAAATALAFFPIFTANLVFAERFKATSDSVTAFGANLLGAMVGGLIEYLALVTGYRALLLVVALLYGLAFLTGRRHLAGMPGAPAPAAAGSPMERAAATPVAGAG
jgi:SAM-dependent methyltransferase